MKTSRLSLASVLAALLALGAWCMWRETNVERPGKHRDAAGDTRQSGDASPERGEVAEQRSSLPVARNAGTQAASPKGADFLTRRQQMELSGYQAASGSGTEARAALARMGASPERLSFLRGMFTRFGETHSPELVGVFKDLTKPGERQIALLTLVELWSPETLSLGPHPAQLAEYGPEGQYLVRMPDNPLLLSLARTLPETKQRDAVLAELGAREVSRDPAHALTYGDGLKGDALAAFQRKVATRWGQLDGAAAWTWVQQQADPALRESLEVAVLTGMEPSLAAQKLPQATEAVRAQSLQALGARWGESDTQSALDWANKLGNAEEKDLALQSIRGVAPVGIGAALTSGPEGYPVIREILPGGSASGVPQLAEGVSIASVRDAQGNVVDLKGKALEDAIGLIRGMPGTALTMEIIPPGGTAANRQVVVLTRRQIMFKR